MSYGARPLGSALGAVVGGLYGAEACLYLAAIIFGAQALVILLSPAVSLARQPDMVGEASALLAASGACDEIAIASHPIGEQLREAIHSFFARHDGLLRCARNDGVSACFVPNARGKPIAAFRSHFI